MASVKAACTHHHARVRKVAEGALASLDDEIGDRRDVRSPAHPIERRLEAERSLVQSRPQRFFSFSATVIEQLRNRPPADAANHHDQNSKSDRLRNSCPKKSKSVSSSCINKTTTTTQNPRAQNFDVADATLVYPKRLSANQRAIAARYLEEVPPPQRQPVLDELEGRLRAEARGARPVYDELRYLHQLCHQVTSGGFQMNLGLKVRDERDERAKLAEQRRNEARAREDERRQQARRGRASTAESPLAEARRILGLPPTNGAKPSSR
jgi:hypothetical protein